MHPAATVYLATNLVNGHAYVGVTRFALSTRWTQHVDNALKRCRTHLHRAIAKYGPEQFSIEAVASCLSITEAGVVERDVIRRIAPRYNQTNGGEITSGRRISPETRDLIRLKNTGLKRTPEQRAANSAQASARYHSNAEYRMKVLAAATRGRERVDREKQRRATGDSARSRIWTPESRAKLSASCMGRRHPPEVLARIAAAKCKPVECLESRIVFGSVSKAAEATGVSITSVSRVCLGQRPRANGLTFKFA